MEDIMGDFFDQIDDLLDFPKDDEFSLRTADHLDFPVDINDDIFLPNNQPQNHQQSITEPADNFDIIPLEWVSQFLNEPDPIVTPGSSIELHCSGSSSPNSVLGPTTIPPIPNSEKSPSSSSLSLSSSSYSSTSSTYSDISAVPSQTRSKRPRSVTTVAASRPRIAVAPMPDPESAGESSVEPLKKKNKSKKAGNKMAASDDDNYRDDAGWENARKCLHCEITKTPQWRAGPLGPKTLCNACGVRYKSGRLFPEYRPAASPTFVPSVHSNSHKKVVEMRNKAGGKRGGGCELLDYIRMQRVN